MTIQDNIDALLPDNTDRAISPEDVRDSFKQVTTVAESAIAKAAETLTGFDREAMDVGGKQNGILQYCHLASSGEIHQIGSDDAGIYTLLTSQTQFADGTALADRTLMQYHDTGETQFSYWRHGELIEVTGSKSIQLDADFSGYIGYNAAGDLDNTITNVRELLVRTPLVVYMYLNGTSDELIWYADERHGIVMDGQTHLQLHQDKGFFVSSGLEVSGIANNNSTFTSISSGGAGDEDVKMFFDTITTAPKLFKEGLNGHWRLTDDDNELGVFRDSKCCYNNENGGDWELSEINNDFVIMMPLATNNKIAPIVFLVGQTLHLNRGAARDNMPAEFYRTKTAQLPGQELAPLNSMIIHNESTGQIEIGTDGEIYTDCRQGFPMGIFS